nr:glycoprotein precursor [Pangolin phlebovirus]
MWKLLILSVLIPAALTALCPHIKNRRMLGNHSVHPSQHKPKEDCLEIDYGKNCPGFDWIANPTNYPLFYSKHHMLTIAEAMNLKLIQLKSNGGCSNRDGKVNCKIMFPRDQVNCRILPTSILGLGEDGAFHLWECPTNQTFSDDCLRCEDKKTPQEQNLIFIDDTVCQVVETKDRDVYPPPIPRDVCRIGTTFYRQCEYPVASIERVHYMLQGLPHVPAYLFDFSVHITEEGDDHEFLCSGQSGKACPISECKKTGTTSDCSGDSTFCDHYVCGSMTPKCSCQKMQGTGTMRIYTAGRWYTPICFGTIKMRVVRNIPMQQEVATRSCTTCTTKCTPTEIIVHTDGILVDSGHLCCSESCIVKMQRPSTTVIFSRPDACKLNRGEFDIILDEEGTSQSVKVQGFCDPIPACSDSSCFWCWANWLNFHCHSTSKLILIWLFFSAVLVVIGVSIGYLKGLWMLGKMLWSPIRWTFLLMKWITCSLGGRVKRAKKDLDSKIMERPLLTQKAPTPDLNQSRTEDGFPRVKGVPIYMYIVCIVLALGEASGCSENHLLSADQTTCVPSGSHLTCTVRGEALIKAGPLGSEACIRFGPSTSKQRRVIKIKTLGSSLKCRKGGSYWTAQFSPKCMSSRRCHLVGECEDSNCEGWGQDQISLEFSHMVDDARLSENGCVEQCGGLGCGCFNINPSCLFYRNEFQLSDQHIYEVFQCAEWVHELRLSASQLQRPDEELIMIDGETKQLDWGSLSVAIDGESITTSNSFHFMRRGSKFAIIDEGFSDIPRKGFLGEIRCPSLASAKAVSSSCLKADGLTRYVGQLDSLRCESRLINPGLIFSRGKLPQSRDGACFTAKPGSSVVEALTSRPIKVVLKATFEGTGIRFDIDPPKCSASFKNITGCYSCNPGSQICMKAGMDKQGSTGTMVLKCPSGIETAIGLTSDIKPHCFMIHTDKQNVNEDCRYSCGREEKKMHIYGSLQYVGLHEDRVFNESSAPVINPRSGSFSWGNWFWGLGSLGGGWIKTLLGSLALVIIGIIIVLICLKIIKSLLLAFWANLLKKKD